VTTVCTVGLAVLDLVMTVDALPRDARKHFADSAAVTGGGPAANAAVTVARLGGSARFVGCVGDDPIGGLIVHDLVVERVDTDDMVVVVGAPSPVSSVLVLPDGARAIVNHTDPRLHESEPGPLPRADAYLADVRWPLGAVAAMEAAHAAAVPGVLDLDRSSAPIPPAAVRRASHVVASIDALDHTDPAEALADLGGRTDGWVGVTLGSDGVAWLDGGTVQHLRPPPIEVVDTLAAGDVFHGAFALALAEGRPEPAALRFATAAAAAKCTMAGGRAGIPDRHTVDELEARPWG
jgi:sulfofructose kinase